VFAELGAIGRSLNQIARAANRGAEPTLRARYSSRKLLPLRLTIFAEVLLNTADRIWLTARIRYALRQS